MITIQEILEEEDLKKAYSVMVQLRTQLSEEDYFRLFGTMKEQGYRLIGLYEDGQVKALAGIIQLTNFYNDKHIYVYDLITDQASRSRGFGEKLLNYVEDLAKDAGCRMMTLTSGNQRIDAHRFYEEKMGFERVSHVFNKKF
ncbi:GNAT family N-acetyltransferase [Metabacillus idriensis]|uniref:GNAT family N-acetyltransferase n=1 Tax=Metabacillus idriensis TaxID=324768 RepID=UPI001CD2E9EA|nr:GNAT family N-acetyltransferase [Metabacillus idriensis]